jgi:DNA-binding transcriptional MerR regulator
MSATYSLSELCKATDATPRTVRYYVQQGLLPSPGTTGPGARYSEGHLDRLRLIKQLQRGHLPLSEIRSRLAALSDDDVRAALAQEPESSVGTAIDYIRAVLGSKGVVPMTGAPAAPATHKTFAVPPPLSSRKGGAAPAAPAPPAAADVPGAGQRLLKTRSLELQTPPPSSHVAPPGPAAPTVARSPSAKRARLPGDVHATPRAAATPAQTISGEDKTSGRRAVLSVSEDSQSGLFFDVARTPEFEVRPDRSTWERIALAPDIELHVRRPLSRVQNRFLDRLLDLVRKLLKEEQP